MFQYPKMSSIVPSCVKVEHSFEFLNGGRCHFCNNWSVPELVSAIERVEWPCNLQSRGISIVLGHVVVFAERSCPLLGLNEPCSEGSRPFSFVFLGAEAADWNCVSWISATVSPNCFGRLSMRIRMCVSWIRVSELCARIALLARCFIQSDLVCHHGCPQLSRMPPCCRSAAPLPASVSPIPSFASWAGTVPARLIGHCHCWHGHGCGQTALVVVVVFNMTLSFISWSCFFFHCCLLW